MILDIPSCKPEGMMHVRLMFYLCVCWLVRHFPHDDLRWNLLLVVIIELMVSFFWSPSMTLKFVLNDKITFMALLSGIMSMPWVNQYQS